MAVIEKWRKRIKKTEIMPNEWDELVPSQFYKKTLGQYIMENYLAKDGDVIEIDLSNMNRRAVGNLLKALNAAKKSDKIEFLLRYSKDGRTAYVKRVG